MTIVIKDVVEIIALEEEERTTHNLQEIEITVHQSVVHLVRMTEEIDPPHKRER